MSGCAWRFSPEGGEGGNGGGDNGEGGSFAEGKNACNSSIRGLLAGAEGQALLKTSGFSSALAITPLNCGLQGSLADVGVNGWLGWGCGGAHWTEDLAEGCGIWKRGMVWCAEDQGSSTEGLQMRLSLPLPLAYNTSATSRVRPSRAR